jgi:CBS domain-containing protein
MNAGTMCRHEVVTARTTDELMSAARLMRDRHIGYLVVVEPEPVNDSLAPVGVLTDRDIVVAVVARDADPKALRVGEVMTRHPVVADEADDIDAVLHKMRRIGVRRLPVVGTRGQLVGVVSIDDILDTLAGELQQVTAAIRHEQRVEPRLRP